MSRNYIPDGPMPHNSEAEVAVLGSVLLNDSCFAQTYGSIEADDFYLPSHRLIFRAMAELIDAGSPVDFVTLSTRLRDKGQFESVGGDGYLMRLTDGLPRIKNISQYITIVREKSQLRTIIQLCTITIDRAYSASEEPGEIIVDTQQKLLDLYRKGGKTAPTLGDYARQCLNSMWEQQRRGIDGCIGLTTGLEELDYAITGYRKAGYYVIGGRPSSGKSSLALQSIRANCRAGRRCGFFSIEMSGEDVFNRLASMETGVKVCDLRDMRTLTRSDCNRVQEAWVEITKWPLDLYPGPRSIRELKATARTLITKGAEIIYVDYLQHPSLKVPGTKIDFDRVTAISADLCDLGKSNNVPVVVLSQLSRPEKKGPSREPRMEDLRQSGQIEQDADVVMLLHRSETKAGEEGGTTFTGKDKIILAKQRNGPAGEFVPVSFDGPMSVYKPRQMKELRKGSREHKTAEQPGSEDLMVNNAADEQQTLDQ